MLTLAVSFPLGTYFATPWNPPEEAPLFEWPPTPWRLLRALTHAAEQAGILDHAWTWLHEFTQPPTYLLPSVAVGYRKGSRLGYVALPQSRRTLYVSWPAADLEPAEQVVLADLLRRVRYLGREDVPAVLTLVDDPPEDPLLSPCTPTPCSEPYDQVLLLSAGPDTTPSGLHVRRPPSGLPPTAMLVRYFRPTAAIRGRLAEQPGPNLTQLFRYSVRSPLPLNEGPRLSEQARRALMALYGRAQGGTVSAVFAGKDPVTGQPASGHRHAHYLPTDEDGDGLIDHLSVYAVAGFREQELAALQSLASIHQPTGKGSSVAVEPASNGDGVSLLGPASRWSSHTPFVPPRHSRRVAGVMQETATMQVLTELAHRGLPEPVELRVQPVSNSALALAPDRRLTQDRAYLLDLMFPEPVRGPIAIGAACHFGLGILLPTELSEGGHHGNAG